MLDRCVRTLEGRQTICRCRRGQSVGLPGSWHQFHLPHKTPQYDVWWSLRGLGVAKRIGLARKGIESRAFELLNHLRRLRRRKKRGGQRPGSSSGSYGANIFFTLSNGVFRFIYFVCPESGNSTSPASRCPARRSSLLLDCASALGFTVQALGHARQLPAHNAGLATPSRSMPRPALVYWTSDGFASRVPIRARLLSALSSRPSHTLCRSVYSRRRGQV